MVRCAIYTRKSTEEGLEQAFNSLDAQREACAAYIRSQQHEGWQELSNRYDDGGFSGGSMERPALASLLDDIRAGRIDTVVVYKVDRLTRSLADFAKIVELFEGQGVSFVSVTQQFNTTTSMGRLTLNVLLSFAQFEREVTAERIRDKIAASRKKGMWMGGGVPVGYRAEERQLVVDEDQAQLVGRIFDLYLELGSVRAVQQVLDAEGIRTPRRTSKAGRNHGGRPFSRGNLYSILGNPVYIGRVRHRGEVFDGRHEAIIDRETWTRVQKQLAHQARRKRDTGGGASQHLFAGLLFDEEGAPLYATQASKQGRRYRYYTSKALVEGREDAAGPGKGWRITGPAFEKLVVEQLQALLRDPIRLMDLLEDNTRDNTRLADLIDRAAEMADELCSEQAGSDGDLLRRLVRRIELRDGILGLALDRGTLDEQDGPGQEELSIELPVRVARRGVESRIVLSGENTYAGTPDAALVRLITRAHRWNNMLATGEAGSLQELSREAGIDRSEIGRVLQLAYLAPDITEAILDGRQPSELTAHRLKRMAGLPLDWAEQRKALGFA
ncbi:recombinase family protein [Minwuia thermotolerans]|nr:recombinase family protein [Minwuia thermotolerans]